MAIRRSRRLTTADLALVREALTRAGLDGALVDHPTPAATGADLWTRSGDGTDAARVLRRVVLPPPPRQAGATVNVTVTLPADLSDAYDHAEVAGAPGRAALLQRAMRSELLDLGLPCPPEAPALSPRVAAAAAARIERRERSRR